MSKSSLAGALILAALLLLAVLAGVLTARHYATMDVDHKLGALPPLPGWAREPLPDFRQFADVKARKKAFFQFLFPRVALANSRIAAQRQRLKQLASGEKPTAEDMHWLKSHAERLRVDSAPGEPGFFDQLLRRLDIVPPSLVLAQAANESAWGTSRFARQGNNLFGQWCFTPGCGLVPRRRGADATHEVARFSSPYASIRGYMTNLNRHPGYRKLRALREQARQRGIFPSGRQLARGLQNYSERGHEYVSEIIAMIRQNDLDAFDRLYRELKANGGIQEPARIQTAMAER